MVIYSLLEDRGERRSLKHSSNNHNCLLACNRSKYPINFRFWPLMHLSVSEYLRLRTHLHLLLVSMALEVRNSTRKKAVRRTKKRRRTTVRVAIIAVVVVVNRR